MAPQKLLRRAPGGMPGARIFLGLFPLKRAFFLSFFSQEPFSSESLSGPCRWLRYRELKSTKVPKYSLPIPRGPSCPRARVNVCEFRGGKRSKVSPRGALNLPAARFLQTKRFDPLLLALKMGVGRTGEILCSDSVYVHLGSSSSGLVCCASLGLSLACFFRSASVFQLQAFGSGSECPFLPGSRARRRVSALPLMPSGSRVNTMPSPGCFRALAVKNAKLPYLH